MKHLLLILLLLPVVLRGQVITTVAGIGVPGTTGDGGAATSAKIGLAIRGTFDKKGNYYFITPNRIRMVDSMGIIHTVAGNGNPGFSGDNGPANLAELDYPIGIATDASGNLFVAERNNRRIRKIDGSNGIITTYAGNGQSGNTGDNGPSLLASLVPINLCSDLYGNLYFSDSSSVVRRIDNVGIITTVAGNGVIGNNGDGGLAIQAELQLSYSICTDSAGSIYIGCLGKVRKVDKISGIINTIAGNGNQVYIGEGMHADSAQFDPYDITIDRLNNLYIADIGSQRVFRIDTHNIFKTVAGNGTIGYSGDNGPADSAQLHNPEGVATDACGNLYIADEANYRIRKVNFYPNCSTTDTTDTTTLARYISIESKIEIYPNPAKEQLTVAGGSKMKDVMILNAIGQVILEQKYNSYKAVLNVSGLKEGMYFVVVKDPATGRRVTKVFLKE